MTSKHKFKVGDKVIQVSPTYWHVLAFKGVQEIVEINRNGSIRFKGSEYFCDESRFKLAPEEYYVTVCDRSHDGRQVFKLINERGPYASYEEAEAAAKAKLESLGATTLSLAVLKFEAILHQKPQYNITVERK